LEPKDSTKNIGYMGFTNNGCPFMPCHQGVERELIVSPAVV
jgi:hypothetical protein